MRITLIILLIQASCFAGPDYVTSQGVRVFCEDPGYCPSASDVQIATDVFAGLVPDTDAFLDYLAEGESMIEVVPEQIFACPSDAEPERRCAGLYYDHRERIEIGHNNCIAYTALVHEMAHQYLSRVSQHQDIPFYSRGGVVNAANNLIFRITCPALH